MRGKFDVLSVILLVILMAGCGSARPVPHVDKVVVYENFVPGGTTNGLKNQFHSPQYGDDTSDSKSMMLNAKDLDEALKTARTIRHFQQKIAGIAFAGKFYDSSSRVHHFLYLKTQKAIIDLSDMQTYQLKDTLTAIEVKGH